jgi:hypothetical protein
VKLVHLVGFITKKLVTMHGHMNVKFVPVKFGYIVYFPSEHTESLLIIGSVSNQTVSFLLLFCQLKYVVEKSKI